LPVTRTSLAHAAAAALLLLLPSPGWAAAEVAIDPVSGSEISTAAPAEPSISGDYLAGIWASQHQDLRAASRFLLVVQAANPTDDALRSATFLTAAAAGVMGEAIRLAPEIAEGDQAKGIARLVLLADDAANDRWSDAQSQARELQAQGITGATRSLLLAWTTLEPGGLAAAQMELDALAPLSSLGVLYHLHRALLADAAGDKAAAAADYDKALAASEQRSVRLVLLIANFRARNGDMAGATALLGEYMTQQPGSAIVADSLAALEAGAVPAPIVANAREGLAEVFFQVGSILAQDSASDSALVEAQLARHMKPGFDAAAVLLGELAQKRKQRLDAIDAFDDVAEGSPYHSTAALGLAEEFYYTGKIDEAAAELQALTDSRLHDFVPPYRLGNLFRAERRFPEAVVAYETAVKRLPAITQQHWSMLYYRGIAYERTGAWIAAEADFRKALELEPEQPQVMNYLAYSWVERQENLDEARQMLLRAVELSPTDGFIVDSLGWALYKLGDFPASVEQLEHAAELEPAEAVINDHLGDAYWMVGRKREARVQWNRALSLAPSPDLDEGKVRAKLDQGLPDTAQQ
jgi:Flp pilus assembly protein TadD